MQSSPTVNNAQSLLDPERAENASPDDKQSVEDSDDHSTGSKSNVEETGSYSSTTEWSCPRCTFKNPLSNTKCEMCSNQRTLDPFAESADEVRVPNVTIRVNNTVSEETWIRSSDNAPGHGAGDRRIEVRDAAPQEKVPVKEWACGACTLLNPEASKTCTACRARKPSSPPTVSLFGPGWAKNGSLVAEPEKSDCKADKAQDQNDGECKCTYLNHKSLKTCEMCGPDTQKIGFPAPAADKAQIRSNNPPHQLLPGSKEQPAEYYAEEQKVAEPPMQYEVIAAPHSGPQENVSGKQWSCGVCTLLNPEVSKTCAACRAQKPFGPEIARKRCKEISGTNKVTSNVSIQESMLNDSVLRLASAEDSIRKQNSSSASGDSTESGESSEQPRKISVIRLYDRVEVKKDNGEWVKATFLGRHRDNKGVSKVTYDDYREKKRQTHFVDTTSIRAIKQPKLMLNGEPVRFELGQRVEVNYRDQGKWYPATFIGKDPYPNKSDSSRRKNYVGVVYDDHPDQPGMRGAPIGAIRSMMRHVKN